MKDLASVIALVKERASLKEILVSKGSITGSLSEEQFSCLFHGADLKKSCRYYEETDTAYCWVCKEKWDVISFCQRLEQMTFPQAINYLIKTYKIDVSGLPNAPEAEISRITSKDIVKLNERAHSIDKVSGILQSVRDEIPYETYARLVYTFMMLKYVVPDESFKDTMEKFRATMLRVFNNKVK